MNNFQWISNVFANLPVKKVVLSLLPFSLQILFGSLFVDIIKYICLRAGWIQTSISCSTQKLKKFMMTASWIQPFYLQVFQTFLISRWMKTSYIESYQSSIFNLGPIFMEVCFFPISKWLDVDIIHAGSFKKSSTKFYHQSIRVWNFEERTHRHPSIQNKYTAEI